MIEQCRYLGTTISIKNTDLDLERQMRKMYANANLLLKKNSKCSINVKCYLLSNILLRLTALIYIVHPCGLIVRKQLWKNWK